jgi:hypothetical protein
VWDALFGWARRRKPEQAVAETGAPVAAQPAPSRAGDEEFKAGDYVV